MSFTGRGPLGLFGWGTTVSQALESQACEVTAAFEQFQHVLQEKEVTTPLILPVDLAAVLTPHEEIDWSESEREEFRRKKQQPRLEASYDAEGVTEIKRLKESWQKVQLEFYEFQKVELEQLPIEQRNVVSSVADLFSVLVVNLHLRETLLYPLVRDQQEDGEALLLKGRLHIQLMKEKLRKVRRTVSYHLHSRTTWVDQIAEIRTLWEKGWREEREVVIPRLVAWLQGLSLPLRVEEICSNSHKQSSLETPDPLPNHNLNYGQQLTQMFAILRGNYLKSGFLNGVPKTRHEPDWSPPDGFQTLPDICFGTLKKPTIVSEKTNDSVLPAIETPKKMSVNRADDYYSKEKNTRTTDEEGIDLFGTLRSLPETFFNSVDKVKTMYESVQAELESSVNPSSEDKPTISNNECHLEALELDVTPVGSHYEFSHFDVQYFRSIDQYRIRVDGNCCERPRELSFDQVVNLSTESIITQPLTLGCSRNSQYNPKSAGCYLWTGIPLRTLLSEIGVSKRAVNIVFTGYDAGLQEKQLRHYQRAVDVNDPIVDFIMLCWQHNGVELSPQHGYPLRMVTPGWYGDSNVKWLQSIEITDREFDHRHAVDWPHQLSFSLHEIGPSALLKPIGYRSLDNSQERTLSKGTHTFVGRSWVGGGFYRTVMSVEVSLDNGDTWMRAKLEPRLGVFGWHRFTFNVTLDVGKYAIQTRAIDSQGLEVNWNLQGNNGRQTIHLNVVDQITSTV